MQTALGTGLNALVAPASTDAEPQDVHAAYDGSNVLFRLLRMVTWGPGLMNLANTVIVFLVASVSGLELRVHSIAIRRCSWLMRERLISTP